MSTANGTDPLLTLAQLAEAKGFTEAELRAWGVRGQLDGVYIPGCEYERNRKLGSYITLL